MCDERAFDDMAAFERRADRLTRREFGVLSAGVGLAIGVVELFALSVKLT